MQQARTTDKYRKVEKGRQPNETPENEVRISANKRIAGYITYTARLLLEKGLDVVTLKASGSAARDAVQVAEILRHKIVNLHQLNKISTVEVIDEYEPLEEGLTNVQVKRNLAVIEIQLSKKGFSAEGQKSPGYQSPLPVDIKEEEEIRGILEKKGRLRLNSDEEGGQGRPRRGGYRGSGGRGGYGGGRPRGYGGRGRGGRGRGGRGYDDREPRDDYREPRDDYREDRGNRGEYRDRDDREPRTGGYRGGNRGGRGGNRGGDRGGDRGDYKGGDREFRGDRGDRGEYRGGSGRGGPRTRGPRGGPRGGGAN